MAGYAVFSPGFAVADAGQHATVYDWEFGLLYADGRFREVLPSGRHRLRWPWERPRRVVHRLQRGPLALPTPPLDVISADRLLFRLGATTIYEVVEPRTAFEQNGTEKLSLAVAAALVRLAAGRELEGLLADRLGFESAMLAALAEPVSGCQARSVSLTNVTLPPELRRLYAEGERAKLEGQAALERARGEQAALRALANAARMLKGNPELMNLRLLQTAERGGGKAPTLVLGAPTGLQAVSSFADPDPDAGG